MLEPFFRWCESAAVGRVVAESVWVFPVLEALTFTLVVRERVARRETDARGTVSLALWFTVAAAGRWIGFS